MHKRTDFLDAVKKNSTDPQCSKFLSDLYEYYKIYDVDTNNFYGTIFHALYIDEFDTYDEISGTHNVALCTIYRLRVKFNNLAIEIAPDELKQRFQSFTSWKKPFPLSA